MRSVISQIINACDGSSKHLLTEIVFNGETITFRTSHGVPLQQAANDDTESAIDQWLKDHDPDETR
jgi:hypothetical protein